MHNFLDSIKSGLDAAADKEKNIKEIKEVIDEVRVSFEEYSGNILTLKTRSSYLDTLNQMALRGLKPHYNKNTPLNQILYLQLSNNPNKEEELTTLFMGAEGYPCSIYVEGNQLTANDRVSLVKHLSSLLAAPSTGQKFTKLLNESKAIE